MEMKTRTAVSQIAMRRMHWREVVSKCHVIPLVLSIIKEEADRKQRENRQKNYICIDKM
jgi:hypothetical protein